MGEVVYVVVSPVSHWRSLYFEDRELAERELARLNAAIHNGELQWALAFIHPKDC